MSIDHARAMQRECAEYILGGGTDRGAWLGLSDWFTEEFLIEQERNDARLGNDLQR